MLAGVALAACGGSKPRSATETTVPGGRPHDDIAALDAAISRDLASAGLTAPTDPELVELMVSHSVPPLPDDTAAASCPATPEGTGCADVCTLADSICGNAAKICDLAEELPGDDWAAQRCASGKTSCERARERCCGC